MSRVVARRERPDVVTLTLTADARAALDARVAAGEGATRSEVVRRLALEAPPLGATAPDATLATLRGELSELRDAVLAHGLRLEALESAAVHVEAPCALLGEREEERDP